MVPRLLKLAPATRSADASLSRIPGILRAERSPPHHDAAAADSCITGLQEQTKQGACQTADRYHCTFQSGPFISSGTFVPRRPLNTTRVPLSRQHRKRCPRNRLVSPKRWRVKRSSGKVSRPRETGDIFSRSVNQKRKQQKKKINNIRNFVHKQICHPRCSNDFQCRTWKFTRPSVWWPSQLASITPCSTSRTRKIWSSRNPAAHRTKCNWTGRTRRVSPAGPPLNSSQRCSTWWLGKTCALGWVLLLLLFFFFSLKEIFAYFYFSRLFRRQSKEWRMRTSQIVLS